MMYYVKIWFVALTLSCIQTTQGRGEINRSRGGGGVPDPCLGIGVPLGGGGGG